jgi:hypothetical protein
MAFASTVLMLAGSPQTLLGVASAHDTFFLVAEVLEVYGGHVGNELAETLVQFRRLASSPPNKRREERQFQGQRLRWPLSDGRAMSRTTGQI